jgi:Flp pilus assembly protein TadG
MRVQRSTSSRRSAVAAVEFAFLLPVMMILLIGIWEIGRLIQVKQVLDNATREGARLAAQGLIINSEGDNTQIMVNTGSPNVEATIRNYLRENGVDTTDLKVTFEFVDGDKTKTQPYQATRGQRFRVSASIPFKNVRWSLLALVNPETSVSAVEWPSLVDEPFTIDTAIPKW